MNPMDGKRWTNSQLRFICGSLQNSMEFQPGPNTTGDPIGRRHQQCPERAKHYALVGPIERKVNHAGQVAH
jgi:hypothetical protein